MGGGGLVDDAKGLHTRYDAAVLGGLALAVIEVRGEGDDGGVRDFVSNVSLGGLLHLHEHHGAYLRCLHRVKSVMLEKNMEGQHVLSRRVAAMLDLDGRLLAFVDKLETPRVPCRAGPRCRYIFGQ